MKLYPRYLVVITTMMMLCCLYATPVLAQPEDPGGEPAPLDGGTSVLVAMGVAYGVKKMREGRMKEKEIIGKK